MTEQELANMYLDYIRGENLEEIAKKYGYKSQSSVLRILDRNGLPKRPNIRNIKNVNHNFFSEIGEIQAYLLGFYLGDGNMSIVGNCYGIHIQISSEDVYIIDLFKEYICPECNITTTMPKTFKDVSGKYYTGKEKTAIHFTSKSIGQYLEAIGYGKNKTQFIKFLPNIPEKMLRHFLRGYFDADGCIMAKIRKEGWMNRRFQLTSLDRTILDELVSYLETKDISSKVYSERNHYHLLVQKKSEVIKLFHLLYDDANFYLDRKFQKFQNVEKTPTDFRELIDSERCRA
jgi:DNA-binding transcriptional regulator WhiA